MPIDLTHALRCIYAFAEDPKGELPWSGPYSFEQVVLTLRSPPHIVRGLLEEMERSGDVKEVWDGGRRAYRFTESGLGVLYERIKKYPVQRTID